MNLIATAEVAAIYNISLDALKCYRKRLGMPKPIVNATKRPSDNRPALYDEAEVRAFAAENDVRTMIKEFRSRVRLGEIETRQYKQRAPVVVPDEKKAQPVVLMRDFLQGKYDHPAIRHQNERRLDKARVRMPRTTRVTIECEWMP